MIKDDKSILIEGVVKEALPDARFSVQMSEAHVVLATLSGKMRKNRINVMVGDMVVVELSPYDLTKGRIVKRNLKTK